MLILAALALGACKLDQDIAFVIAQTSTDEPVDRPAPALDGELLEGGTFDPATLASARVVVVNFWGSWCGPCRREQPGLVRLAHEYAPRGVAFVGVDFNDNRDNGLAFKEEFQTPYKSIFDPPGRLVARFQVVAMPTTFVLRDGRLVHRFIGAVLEERLREVLGEQLRR